VTDSFIATPQSHALSVASCLNCLSDMSWVIVGLRNLADAVSVLDQDQNDSQVYIGITHLGVVTFQGTKRTRVIYWSVTLYT